MSYEYFNFHLRWLFWILGFPLLLCFCSKTYRPLLNRWIHYLDGTYRIALPVLCTSFFILAYASKYSQFNALEMNGQDFWLFVDLLENAKKGLFFITRFAPQATGYVQHGAVHATFTWAILVPFAWLIGSVHTALISGPLVLAGAAFLLSRLTRKTWGNGYSLIFSFAFLASTQVGKIVMYEVHPETAYPFFLFLWFFGLGLDHSGKVRLILATFAAVLCAGVKEDSFLIMIPWLVWGFIRYENQKQRTAFMVSGFAALMVMVGQMLAIRGWTEGILGPHHWNHWPVVNRPHIGFLQGRTWSSLTAVFDIANLWYDSLGGLKGCVSKYLQFLFSRPWLSILALAPWVCLSPRFWWVSAPLGIVYSLISGPQILINYYSAPFLGSFWFCAASLPTQFRARGRKHLPTWLSSWRSLAIVSCLVSIFLGGKSLEFIWPSSEVSKIKAIEKSLVSCIPAGTQGMVSGHLIPLVSFDQIATDRIPQNSSQWDLIQFVLFSPGLSRYELSMTQALRLYENLSNDSSWVEVGSDCKPVRSRSDASHVQSKAFPYPTVVLMLKTPVQ